MTHFTVRLAAALMIALASLGWARAQAPHDPALLEALDEAIAAYNATAGNPNHYRQVWYAADATGAVALVEVIDPETGLAYPGVIDWVYVSPLNGRWRAVRNGQPGYRDAYRALSDSLKGQADGADLVYRTPADPALYDEAAMVGYELPFPQGTVGVVTRSYGAHGIGRIDFDLQGTEVSAPRDGVIVFASDGSTLQAFLTGGWWHWNTVIIRHADHAYSLVGHLAPGSLPDWVREGCPLATPPVECALPVQAGQVIGLEGNTGNSTNPHVHLEFGQGYGVVPYLDWLDGDADGNRLEVIYAGYIYGEHDVALNGATVEETSAWPYLTVLESQIGG